MNLLRQFFLNKANVSEVKLQSEQSVLYGLRDIYFEEAAKVAINLALLYHSVMLIYANYIGVMELVYINYFSVATYIISLILLKKNGQLALHIVSFCAIEVIIHSSVGVYCLGVNSGLGLFVWLVVLLFFLSSKLSRLKKILLCSGILLVYSSFIFHSYFYFPQYTLDSATMSLVNQSSIISSSAITVAITYYFSTILRKKEELILREIHHRVINNLQVLSSISTLHKSQFDEPKYNSQFESLKGRINAMSIIHKNISLGNSINQIDAKKMIKEIVLYVVGQNKSKQIDFSILDQKFNLDIAIPFGLLAFEVISEMEAFSNWENSQINLKKDDNGEINMKIKTTLKENTVFPYPQVKQSISEEIIEALTEQLDADINFYENDNTVCFEFSQKKSV